MIKGLRPFNWATILILMVFLIQDKRYSELKIESRYFLPIAEKVN